MPQVVQHSHKQKTAGHIITSMLTLITTTFFIFVFISNKNTRTMSLKKPANLFLTELMQKWQQLQLVPNVFAYKLDVNQSRFLPGKYQFYSEVIIIKLILHFILFCTLSISIITILVQSPTYGLKKITTNYTLFGSTIR